MWGAKLLPCVQITHLYSKAYYWDLPYLLHRFRWPLTTWTQRWTAPSHLDGTPHLLANDTRQKYCYRWCRRRIIREGDYATLRTSVNYCLRQRFMIHNHPLSSRLWRFTAYSKSSSRMLFRSHSRTKTAHGCSLFLRYSKDTDETESRVTCHNYSPCIALCP